MRTLFLRNLEDEIILCYLINGYDTVNKLGNGIPIVSKLALAKRLQVFNSKKIILINKQTGKITFSKLLGDFLDMLKKYNVSELKASEGKKHFVDKIRESDNKNKKEIAMLALKFEYSILKEG